MGEADRYKEYATYKTISTGNSVKNLLILNAVVFLVLFFIEIGYNANTGGKNSSIKVWEWFALNSSANHFITRPWTLLTYMFSHTGNEIFNFISNCIWLFVLGSFLRTSGYGSQITPAYIYSGVVGALFLLLAAWFIKDQLGSQFILGANISLMGLATFAVSAMPGYRFFQQIGNGIPLWIFYAVFVLLNVAYTGNNYPLLAGYAGAALAGWVYYRMVQSGNDVGAWMDRLGNYFIGMYSRPALSNNAKDKIFYNTGNRKPFQKTSIVSQKRVDDILDKVNQKGFNSLTAEEKDILKRASKEL